MLFVFFCFSCDMYETTLDVYSVLVLVYFVLIYDSCPCMLTIYLVSVLNWCTLVLFSSVLLFLYFCFFFFKQKTAYELRISDWSSDVCSSDLAVGHRLHERLDPAAPVLDDGDLQLREAREGAVADHRRNSVLDRAPRHEHPERLRLEREHLGVAAVPVVDVAGVAAVGRVPPDEDVVLDDLLPERVELREAERARAPVAGHWSGPDEHDLGAALHHPLELLDGLLHDRQSDDRRGEDAVGVAELPGLVEPLVEGVHDRVGGFGVVAQALLHEAGQRGEHERAVEALLVHQLEARPGLAERGDGPHRLAEDRSEEHTSELQSLMRTSYAVFRLKKK